MNLGLYNMFFRNNKNKKVRKFGISYNLFDGEELLESSILCLRHLVDYISVVYQTESNFGNKCSPDLLPLLKKLRADGLINELYHYEPNLKKGGHFNELVKRNIGLKLSRKNGCDYHMSMDADEFYLADQFSALHKTLIEGDYDSSACQMRTYYKSPKYQLSPPEDYYVSLFFKIRRWQKFKINTSFPVLVDPTRKMKAGKCKVFLREEIEMHHMSYVRKDIRTKLNNSSASINFKNESEKIANYYENWKYPEPVLFVWEGHSPKYLRVIQVDNQFRNLYIEGLK
jgi:hypothetical protein